MHASCELSTSSHTRELFSFQRVIQGSRDGVIRVKHCKFHQLKTAFLKTVWKSLAFCNTVQSSNLKNQSRFCIITGFYSYGLWFYGSTNSPFPKHGTGSIGWVFTKFAIFNAVWIELPFIYCVLLPSHETVLDYNWDTGNPSKFLQSTQA